MIPVKLCLRLGLKLEFLTYSYGFTSRLCSIVDGEYGLGQIADNYNHTIDTARFLYGFCIDVVKGRLCFRETPLLVMLLVYYHREEVSLPLGSLPLHFGQPFSFRDDDHAAAHFHV